MMNKITRAEKSLDRIQARTGLSDEGRKWLVAVLDPMHDSRLECCGYPDRETNPSVVQVIKKTVSISRPAGYAGNWGFHAYLDDYLANDIATGGLPGAGLNNLESNNLYINHEDAYQEYVLGTGGLNIISFEDDGTEPNICLTANNGVSTNTRLQLQADPATFLTGKVRCLAQGMEIVNTSTDLYKGGAIAVYEQPGSKEDLLPVEVLLVQVDPLKHDKGKKDGITATTNRYRGTRGMTLDVLPPQTLNESMLLPGTQQWDAKQGAYAVQTMNDMENPPSFGTTNGSIYLRNENTFPKIGAGFANTSSDNMLVTSCVSGGANDFLYVCGNYNVKIPFNRKGLIVTGQVDKATFTLNYNVIIERIISSQDSSLATLASPSPPEDYIATQLYSEIVQKLPLAVKFSDNDFGEWFLGCVDEVANVVSSIGKPVMQAVNTYQEGRRAGPTVASSGATFVEPQVLPTRQTGGKIKKKKNGQKVIVQGPRMQTGSFNTAASKQATKAKKRVRKGKAPKQ